MTWIDIPENWTGKEALCVVELLDEISAAIWTVHEPKMLDAWQERFAQTTETAVDDEDPIPVDCPYDRYPDPIPLDESDDIPF